MGDGTPATSAILHQPSDVALDTSGNLFIADTGTGRVRIVFSTGLIQTLAGDGTAGYNTDGVPATSAELYAPMGLAFDPSGDLLLADMDNQRVREISAGVILTFAGTGAAGTGEEGLEPAEMPLRYPRGVCTGRDGSVYIADTNNHRVLVVPPHGVVATFAGNGSPGGAGDGEPARQAQLNLPSACVLDGSGDVFIADTANHRIREVTPAGVIATVAGSGAAGYSGDGGAATAAALYAPSGVAVDSSGDVFIADTGNHAIRLVTPDGIIHTIAGQGAAGFSGDGGAALAAFLNSPSGMRLDGAGDLYFADTGNNRVRRLAPDVDVVTVGPPPATPALALVNAASQSQGAVSPGEIVTIYGAGIGPTSGVTGSLDASGLVGNLLAGAEVRFDGVPAPLFYAQASQINAQVPYTVAGESATQVEVFYQGQLAGALSLPVVAAAPALFAAALNQDGSVNSSTAPAARGTVVTFFGTGEGLTNGANIAGQPAAAPYPIPTLPVTLTVSGIAAQLLYAGEAPTFAGLLQVDAVIPGGFVPSGPVAVQLTPDIFLFLQKFLQFFITITTDIANRGTMILHRLVKMLNQFLAPLFRERRDGYFQYLAIVHRIQTQVRGTDNFFDDRQQARVPGLHGKHRGIRHSQRGHLIERCGRSVILHLQVLQQGRGSAAGSDPGEFHAQILRCLRHAGSCLRHRFFDHPTRLSSPILKGQPTSLPFHPGPPASDSPEHSS